MADVEAIILYRPSGFERDGEFRLARTTQTEAVRAVAEAALAEARETASLYEGLDPALAGSTRAEVVRLDAVLRQIVPGYEAAPEPARPRLVPPPDPERG